MGLYLHDGGLVKAGVCGYDNSWSPGSEPCRNKIITLAYQTDAKIDGNGLDVAKIGAEVVDSVFLGLYLHHGDLAKAGVGGYDHF